MQTGQVSLISGLAWIYVKLVVMGINLDLPCTNHSHAFSCHHRNPITLTNQTVVSLALCFETKLKAAI